MQPPERHRHRVFPEGFDIRPNRLLNEEQRAEHERLFAEARQQREAEDVTGIAAVLQEIHGNPAHSSAYRERLFPAFENLSPAQQRLIIGVMDPDRLATPQLDQADQSMTVQVQGSFQPSLKGHFDDLVRVRCAVS